MVFYLSEKRFNEVFYDGMDEEEEKVKFYSDRIFLLFNLLKQYYREDIINLVIVYLFIMGSEEGGFERSI